MSFTTRDALVTARDAGWIPVTRQMLQDVGRDPTPWIDADPSPFPYIDPVPALTATIGWLADARDRVAFAVGVLRHGVPEREECW